MVEYETVGTNPLTDSSWCCWKEQDVTIARTPKTSFARKNVGMVQEWNRLVEANSVTDQLVEAEANTLRRISILIMALVEGWVVEQTERRESERSRFEKERTTGSFIELRRWELEDVI
jgi:hypothetical protein